MATPGECATSRGADAVCKSRRSCCPAAIRARTCRSRLSSVPNNGRSRQDAPSGAAATPASAGDMDRQLCERGIPPIGLASIVASREQLTRPDAEDQRTPASSLHVVASSWRGMACRERREVRAAPAGCHPRSCEAFHHRVGVVDQI